MAFNALNVREFMKSSDSDVRHMCQLSKKLKDPENYKGIRWEFEKI